MLVNTNLYQSLQLAEMQKNRNSNLKQNNHRQTAPLNRVTPALAFGRATRIQDRLPDRLFKNNNIVVIGASSSKIGVGNKVVDNLLHGFQERQTNGNVYAVTPMLFQLLKMICCQKAEML